IYFCLIFPSPYVIPRYPHSFPTRRSSDLMSLIGARGRGESVWMAWFLSDVLRRFEPLAAERGEPERAQRYAAARESFAAAAAERSEEHASELQSRENLVCRLLLEKKK